MIRKTYLGVSALIFILLSFTAFSADDKGLSVGELAPQISTNDIDGHKFDLNESLQQGPVVLVFYRGGWCPYCNRQLRKLQADVVPKLGQFSAKLVAISVDRPDEIEKTKQKESLGMTLISDPAATLIKQYRVVNQTSNELVRTYKEEYDIDLEAASGQKHHIIAVPAVFTIAQDGKIAFAYANTDYTVRTQNQDILSSLASLQKN